VREVSVAKGNDPRDFVLLASGGAGPLHAVEIARELHIPRVIVPRYPGHFSALGMLLTDQRHDLVQTIYARLDRIDAGRVLTIYRELAERLEELIGRDDLQIEAFFDMRYAGQDFTLPVPVLDRELAEKELGPVRARFDEVHERRYGHHAADEAAEVVNLRLTGFAPREKPSLAAASGESAPATPARAAVHFTAEAVDAPVYARDALGPGDQIAGPALIEEYASTTVFFDGDRVTVAPSLELLVDVA